MTITARYRGTCSVCGDPVEPGDEVEWNKAEKTVAHADCDGATPSAGEETSPSASPATFAPTKEQEVALELFRSGDSLAIEAGAGTGKTSTLVLLAGASAKRGQYVAFNKAIVSDAGGKMPDHVTSSTAHSLAFRAVGRDYSDRLRSAKRLRSMDIANHLGLRPVELDGLDGKPKILPVSFLAGLVMRAVGKFCQTADPEIGTSHVPYVEGIDVVLDGRRSYVNNEILRRALVPALGRAWADLVGKHGRLPFRHDHYLKLWQLSGPKIGADFILFDEAQDANPVMTAIVAAQTHAQLVWVGDSQQEIYAWAGAVNALAHVPADRRAFLTQSFRFGPAIAEVANSILSRIEGAELRLRGTESVPSVVGSVAEPDALLTRTNATAVRAVLSEQRAGGNPALVGGGDEVARFARGVQQLERDGATEHPDLACFSDWAEVRRYVDEDEQGSELRLNVKLVEEFGVEVILDALDHVAAEKDASLVVSTAHKSKGREWAKVQIAGDFPDGSEKPLGNEELRLLYVSCTRAKIELDIDGVAALRDDAPGVESAGKEV